MKYYDEFRYPGKSEEPDWEEPTSAQHALGEVLLSFQALDDQVSLSISFLIGRGDDIGEIVTARLAFRAKLDLLGVLFRHERIRSANLDRLSELLAACEQIEGKRNEMVHSRWQQTLDGVGMTRTKVTVHRKKGLQTSSEVLTPGQVRAIGHQCGYLIHSLDELMYVEFGTAYGQA
jgi:hypothetical protein